MDRVVSNFKTKFTPFRCPNCNGWGTVTYKKIECHACKGKGFIIIDQDTGELKEVENENTTA